MLKYDKPHQPWNCWCQRPHLVEVGPHTLMKPVIPERVKDVIHYAMNAYHDELMSRSTFEPRSESIQEAKDVSKWLFHAEILNFDPLARRS